MPARENNNAQTNRNDEKFKEKVLESVQHNNTVSLIMYMWISLEMESYMTVMNFVDENWKLHSVVLEVKQMEEVYTVTVITF